MVPHEAFACSCAEEDIVLRQSYKPESCEGLILKGNQLEGELRISLSTCQRLRVLDLGNNHLNGTFPGWLGDLPNLQVLVLKSNNFCGRIQPSVTVGSPFTSLLGSDLSHNRFVGKLPAKYFQNFNSMKNVVKNSTKPEYLNMDGFYYSFVVAVKGVDQDFPQISIDYTIIDMSNNTFEGQIPNDEYHEAHSLTHLALPGLYGFPLPKRKHQNSPQVEDDNDKEVKESGFTCKVATLGYGCGTLVGLVMVLGFNY
nr:leucine-rich repeat-containing protein [Tanacetum cinerariifolium]